MVLHPKIIRILKEPLGELILNDDITKKIRDYVRDARVLATVGDATTSKLLSYGIVPDLFIVDGKERREKSDTSKISLSCWGRIEERFLICTVQIIRVRYLVGR